MLVNGLTLLRKARKKRRAVGAFNINNMESLQGIVSACKKRRASAIIQTTENAIGYAGIEYLYNMVSVASRELELALHLDHGKNLETVRLALKTGYTSVMFDGSSLPYEKNILMTKKAVRMAGEIPVEGELGSILKNHEILGNNIYTDPQKAKEFVKKTGISSLAVAIGTRHGFNKGDIKLRYDILKEIHESVDIPLVLHGGSELTAIQIKKCIKLGICKVNIDSELRKAFTDAVRGNCKEMDPRKVLDPARNAVEAVVIKKLNMIS